MSEMPKDLQELYCKYGQTAEMAQVLEFEAGNFALAYASLLFNPETITDQDSRIFQAVIDDVDRRTFGNLLTQIRKIATISDDIEKTVSNALDRRNYLVHRFFKVHNFAIHSEVGRKSMISELDAIYRDLTLAHAVLSGMTHTFNEAFGRPNISEDQVEELLRRGKKLDI